MYYVVPKSSPERRHSHCTDWSAFTCTPIGGQNDTAMNGRGPVIREHWASPHLSLPETPTGERRLYATAEERRHPGSRSRKPASIDYECFARCTFALPQILCTTRHDSLCQAIKRRSGIHRDAWVSTPLPVAHGVTLAKGVRHCKISRPCVPANGGWFPTFSETSVRIHRPPFTKNLETTCLPV